MLWTAVLLYLETGTSYHSARGHPPYVSPGALAGCPQEKRDGYPLKESM